MIIERSARVKVKMSEVKIGEVFSINDDQDVYMKIVDSCNEYGDSDNCVNLSTGYLDYIEPDNIVRKESAKLVIE